MPQSNIDKLVRSTVRIESVSEGSISAYGSGLLMLIYPFGGNDERHVAVVVTNKHVVDGSDTVRYTLPSLIPGQTIISQAPTSAVLMHPDGDIDLCLIPVPEAVVAKDVHHGMFISSRDVWSEKKLETLSSIENVVMIGYPNGLIDQKGLFPISRRGITATPSFEDFDGRSDFMIDCACFPGSSGSPVFLADFGMHTDKENNIKLGESRFGLLAFLYAGPILTVEGKIIAQRPPLKLEKMVEVPLMMNLGICVKAYNIEGFYGPLKALAE